MGQGGSFARALAVLWLCAPDLVEVRGCVLRREQYEPANFGQWWERLDGDTQRIEQVLNHLHLWDVFAPDDLPEGALEHFALRLAELWRGLLPVRFPDRRFDVDVDLSPEAYGPTLSFTSSLRSGSAG